MAPMSGQKGFPKELEDFKNLVSETYFVKQGQLKFIEKFQIANG